MCIEWENIIKINIQKDFELVEKENESINDKEKIFQMFISKIRCTSKIPEAISLNKKVKWANNALISDSLLFSRGIFVQGLQIARAFVYEERMREAVFGAP